MFREPFGRGYSDARFAVEPKVPDYPNDSGQADRVDNDLYAIHSASSFSYFSGCGAESVILTTWPILPTNGLMLPA